MERSRPSDNSEVAATPYDAIDLDTIFGGQP
jgi:hypothetical protein